MHVLHILGWNDGRFVSSSIGHQTIVNHHIVTEILFSILLEGYIQTLEEAISAWSVSWGLKGDVCAVSSLPLITLNQSQVSQHNSAASGVPQLTSYLVPFHLPSILQYAEQMSRNPGPHWISGPRLCLVQRRCKIFWARLPAYHLKNGKLLQPTV